MRKSPLKTILIVAVLALIFTGLLLYVENHEEVRKARSDLHGQIEKYSDEAEVRAANLAFDLAKPYLDERRIGRYEQRLFDLDRPGTTIGFHVPSDYYNKVIWDLGTIEVTDKLDESYQQGKISKEEHDRLIKEPPYTPIMNMHSAVQSLSFVWPLDPDKEPSSLEEVDALRNKFAERKLTMDAALQAANDFIAKAKQAKAAAPTAVIPADPPQ